MPIVSLPEAPVALGAGSSVASIIGTKTSGPRGIESQIEFRGLRMNVRDWIDTYLVSHIDGLDDPDVRDNRDNNPDDDGETPFDSFYGGRTLVLQGKIITRTIWKMRDMEQALRQAFSDLSQEYPLIFRTNDVNTDLLIYCKKHQKLEIPDEQTTKNGFERTFSIPVRASNFRFLSYIEAYQAVNFAGGNPVTASFVNNGNFPARPKFTLFGPMTASAADTRLLRIYNARNKRTLYVKSGLSSASLIPAGHTLVIDLWQQIPTAVEYDATGTFVAIRGNYIDPMSDIVQFEPVAGDNPITFENYNAAGAPSSIETRHRHSYL